MNNKNVKVVDEHNIDRNAIIMFAFDLEGSEYVTYWIERDEDNSNIFVSKVIKNLDGTFNMLDVDDSMEKSKLVDIVKSLITTAVNSNKDKLDDSLITMTDGKIIKFISVLFNKEQRINVQKTYITTVKKEVTRVTEKYYAIDVMEEDSKIFENIFPTIDPVSKVETEEIKEEVPKLNVFVPSAGDLANNLSSENDDSFAEKSRGVKSNDFVAFGTETTIPEPSVISTVAPTVVEPITVGESSSGIVNTVNSNTLSSSNSIFTSSPASETSVDVEQSNVSPSTLVFNAVKETNLNAALGEVASSTSIPVENIEPIREFGVDAVVKAPVEVSKDEKKVSQTENSASTVSGFANSKFFMVVAVAFFLASCVFLGYEVFNYFQLTK